MTYNFVASMYFLWQFALILSNMCFSYYITVLLLFIERKANML